MNKTPHSCQYRAGWLAALVGGGRCQVKSFERSLVKRRKAILLGLFLAFLWPIAATAAGTTVPKSKATGIDLFVAGSYEQALPHFLAALQTSVIETGAESAQTTSLLSELSDLYWFEGRYDEAESLYTQYLASLEARLGPNDSGLAQVLSYLSTLYGATGRYDEAERNFERSLGILASAEPEDDPRTAMAAYNLATVYEFSGRQEDAADLYSQALDIWIPALGPNHPNVVSARTRLAKLRKTTEGQARSPYAPSQVIPAAVSSDLSEVKDTDTASDAPGKPAEVQHREELEVSAGTDGSGKPDGRPEPAGQEAQAVEAAGAVAAGPQEPGAHQPAPATDSAPAALDVTTDTAALGQSAAYSSGDEAGYRVHLASVFNADRVAQEREWSRLRDMYPDLLADLDLTIVKVDLGPEKGLYHRIMAGPLTDETAPALCAELAKRGAWCQAVEK